MKILHFMASGETGGIEVLNKDYVKYSKLENIHVFFWHGGCITEEMKAHGDHVIELNAPKKDFFGPLKNMMDLCKKEAPDVIIVHYIAPVLYLYAMILKKRYPHIRIIGYVHENVLRNDQKTGIGKKIRRGLKQSITRHFLKNADGILAISDFVKQRIAECYKISEEKIKRIYNGTDLRNFELSANDSHKQCVLIYVGRLVEEKGVQYTIRALARIAENNSWHFSVVGEGSFRENLEQLVNELGLEKKVEFLGNQRNIPELLSKADIFLHIPYDVEYEEGFGIAMVEAMAAGLICVGSNSGALPELIDDEQSGYLIKDVRSQEFPKKLLEIMGNLDSEKMQLVRQRAREKAENFSIEIYAKNLDQYLSEK